ncbi:LacI family DNA-binding transcriptional regulator [uncultured Serinicoccus sp.]|uniref:LacI family DNA-binding transcriptional regulator n=1 Tax=uncultured Serinicoccus sp. TaxID=735514 RepID=UPI002606ABAB|nr:LacI family DNA-binding transcriptional regulator [uncultured Serinicoccus sp.]
MMTGAAAPRLVDIAQSAGVSVATASRALSGRQGVSTAVAERVKEIAESLGYIGNVHARSLAGGTSSSVGLVVHEVADPYFSEIASGVMRVAGQRGLSVQMCHSGRDPQIELRQLRTLIANRVGVIVVAGSGYLDPEAERSIHRELTRFTQAGGRVVAIGRHQHATDAVLPANTDGAQAVTRHLLALGHRRVAVITGSLGLTTVADRLTGVHRALAEAGIPREDVPVIEAPFTRDGGRTATLEMLGEHPGSTAVLALNDDMAIGALSVLRSRSLRVPEDMSVTGFDDVPVAADLSPSLTTVRLPMQQMGEKALELALRPATKRPRRVVMPATLVERDSSGPPRRS